MSSTIAPYDAATETLVDPRLPAGDDERFVGYGVMGLPFASGHYLALRCMAATSFGPSYHGVWHRDPGGDWTFYMDQPAEVTCPRFFGAASERPVRTSHIAVRWLGPVELQVLVDDVLRWELTLAATPATRLMSGMGSRLPEAAWRSPGMLSAMGRMAGPMLDVGTVRLRGNVPNGQWFQAAPERIWTVSSSSAELGGTDLGRPGPLPEQARLRDFWLPQRGTFYVGSGHFEPLDPGRHLPATG